jgi:hypothetical protein
LSQLFRVNHESEDGSPDERVRRDFTENVAGENPHVALNGV